MLTDFEKRVYNLWLASVRGYHDKPFKLRKDFSEIDETHVLYPHIKALAGIFADAPHMMCPEYFHAPFIVLKNPREYYSINFYCTFKAITLWTTYITKMERRDPDRQLNKIKESFKFIYEYCKERKLRLIDYAKHREKKSAQYAFLHHIKSHKVSPYVAFEVSGLYDVLINLDEDIYELYFGDMDLVAMSRAYRDSKVAHKITQGCTEIVGKKLENLDAE